LKTIGRKRNAPGATPNLKKNRAVFIVFWKPS